MLDKLHEVEKVLPELLAERGTWRTYLLDRYPPTMLRVVREWKDGIRVYLHKTYPCPVAVSLFHWHAWPTAMRVIEGTYRLELGFGDPKVNQSVRLATIILNAGREYEMTHPHAWHSVTPISEPTISLCVTGQSWGRVDPFDTEAAQLGPITEEQKMCLFEVFDIRYSRRKS